MDKGQAGGVKNVEEHTSMSLYTRLCLLKKTKNEPEISTPNIQPFILSTRTWAGPEQDVPSLNP